MSDDEVEVIRVGYRRFLTWGQRSPDFAVALFHVQTTSKCAKTDV